MPLLSRCSPYRTALPTTFLLTLFSGPYYDCSVSRAQSRECPPWLRRACQRRDNSDVPAASMLQARSFGSACGSSRSWAQVRRSRPSCSRPVARLRPPELTVATGSSRSSVVHTASGYLCPRRHSQAAKPLSWYGLDGHLRSISSQLSSAQRETIAFSGLIALNALCTQAPKPS